MSDTNSRPAAQAVPVAGTAVAAPAAGQVVRQGAMGTELATTGETSSSALAAEARARIEARFIMAMRRPRNMDQVRVKLLAACERPGFAGSAAERPKWGEAWYRKPVGEGVEGLSVRFAEEALRCMGNMDVQTTPVYDDDHKRVVMVEVLDLENNLSFPTSITIAKTVERKKLRQGEVALRVRTNAGGQVIYIMEATDDEVFQRQQNMASKAIRNGALRHIPGDVLMECRTRILAIRNGEAAANPEGFRRKVVDGFAKLNVLPTMLEELLGHPLAQCTPAELTHLRELWLELNEGRTTWAEVMAEVSDAREAGGGEAAATSEEGAPRTGLGALTERLRAQHQPPAGAPAPAPATPATAPPPASAPAPAPATNPARERQPGEDDDDGQGTLPGTRRRGPVKEG